MATVIVSTSTTPTLANFKADCKRLSTYLKQNSFPACQLTAGTAAALDAIAASGDSTDLRTT